MRIDLSGLKICWDYIIFIHKVSSFALDDRFPFNFSLIAFLYKYHVQENAQLTCLRGPH